MASATLTVDVMRIKHLFQHEDIALTTSPCVTVVIGHEVISGLGEEEQKVFTKQTATVKEEASPYFNATMTFDLTCVVSALPLSAWGGETTESGAPKTLADGRPLGRPPPDYLARILEKEGRSAPVGASENDNQDESAGNAHLKATVSCEFHVYDNNKSPPMFVAKSMLGDLSVVETSKGDFSLGLTRDADPAVEDAGTMTVKYNLKFTKPAGAPVDPDADVQLPYEPRLTGDYPLVPTERLNVWYHLHHDAAWRDRLVKAMVLAFPNEKAASRGGAAGGKGGLSGSRRATMSASIPRGSGAAAASSGGGDAGDSGVVSVVQHRWKCHRLHQIFTKLRLAAVRQMTGVTPLAWDADTELEHKALWVDAAAVRRTSLSGADATASSADRAKSKIRPALESAWVYYLTGEHIPAGGQPTFEQTTKKSTATFSRSAYEALASAMIEMLVPQLAGAPIVGLIARETYEADPLAQGSRAFKAAEAKAKEEAAVAEEERLRAEREAAEHAKLAASTKGRGNAAGNKAAAAASEPTSPMAPSAPAKKRPGEAAQESFNSLVMYYCDWWAETFTELEYVSILNSLEPVCALARAKADGGAGALGASTKGRPSSGSKRRGSSVKKKKKG